MIVVKKKMKKPLIIVILAAVLAVLTVAAILLDTFLLIETPDETAKSEPPVVNKDIGEDIYLNSALAYTRAEESHIISLAIGGGDRAYSFSRVDIDNDASTVDPLVFHYRDDKGDIVPYLPNIMYEDGGFEYDDVYALEQNDGYGTIKKLTYLTTAFGTLYFDQKLELPADEAERKKELSAFGFGEEDSPITVIIRYNKHTSENEDDHSSEQEVSYTVKIGNKLATNSGYYYMIEGRDIIYTTYTNYLDYAFIDFTDFINPILVAAGLPQDNSFEPYLTTDYQQYKNTLYDYKDGEYSHTVVAGSDVIVSANVIKPDGSQFKKEGDDVTVHVKGGLATEADEDVTFTLGKYAGNADQNRIIGALVGKNTGKYAQPFVLTLPVYSNTVDIAQNIRYKYVIKSVEAILAKDGADNTAAGTVIAEGDSIRIKYELYKNGVKACESDMYGVIDLASAEVPQSLRSMLQGRTVGSFAGSEVTFEHVYDSATSVVRNVKMVVDKIIAIYDADGAVLETAKEGASVFYRYTYEIDGTRLEGWERGEVVIGDHASENGKKLSEAFKDKPKGDITPLELTAYTTNSEFIASYTSYEIDEIKYFVVKEKIVSFKFQQASKRDPYYGESLYMNTTGGEYELYALNASACEAVVKILGGLLTNASSSTGLVGARTVDVVITPEKLRQYNLYDYSVYFELPRGIEARVYDSTTSSMEQYLTNLDDYDYVTTLGFNLYISKPDPVTGKRYIASDMYDIIAELDASDDFIFLEQNFVDFYARRNIVLVNVENVASVNLEFMMEDRYGTYYNELRHAETYTYGGRLYKKSQLTEAQLQQASKYDSIEVVVTPSGSCYESELSKFLAEKNYTQVSFREFYGADKTDRMDSLGTSYFKEFIETLFNTRYHGTLSDEEQAAAYAGGELVMRMTVNLVESEQYSPLYHYVYEFYRISSRRVMVKISQVRRDGSERYSVSDFYVSNFAFKKLCSKYFDLLEGNPVNNEAVFSEERPLD